MPKQKADLSKCDLYGQTIAFTFKGQAEYKSVFGSVMSILCIVIFALFFGFRTEELLSGRNATIFSTKTRQSEAQEFDLLDLGHYFAISVVPNDVATVTL